MKRFIVFIMLFIPTLSFAVGSPDFLPNGAHPRIWLTSSELSRLAIERDSSNSKWTALEAWCDSHISDAGYTTHPANQTTLDLTNWGGDNNYTMGYRMSGWAKHLYSYGLAYQILKQPGSGQNISKANTYAARARILMIDGISRSLSAGEETGNGLHAIRVGSLHDISINETESRAMGYNGYANYKQGYSARGLAAVPVAYDWIHDTLSPADKTELAGMMLRWVDWSRGKRSVYNNGVLVNGARHYEDADGPCVSPNTCTDRTGVSLSGYAYANIANNFGSGFAAMIAGIGVATYGDVPESPAYLSHIKSYLANTVVEPLSSDIKHSGGDSPEGWNYGGGFIYSLPALYGYYTATGDPAISNMTWPKDLVRAMVHRVGGDNLTVPLWGYWTGTPMGVNRIGTATKYIGIAQKMHPTSDEAKIGQYILDNTPFTQTLDEWESMFFSGNGITASSPTTLNEPLSYVAKGNGLYASRSSWTDTKAVHVTTRLESKVTTAHEGYDEGHISVLRGSDVLLGHNNEIGDAPPAISFNTIVFNSKNHTTAFVPTKRAIDRYQEGVQYSYVSGDITGSWWFQWGDNNAEKFRRSVLHIRPNIIVVADVTQSTANKGFLKDWYTQYEADPTISENTITATKGTSKVFVTSLYPSGSFTKTNPALGYYSVRYTPTVSQEYDQFLHVIQADASTADQIPTTLITGTGCRGVKSGDNVAIFTDAPSGANIGTASYVVDATTHYIADLQPLTEYAITATGANTLSTTKTASSAGIIELDLVAAGDTTVSLTGGSPSCASNPALCTTQATCTNAGWNYCTDTCQSAPCPTVPVEPTCSDGIKNGTETGVDCGGSCPNTCEPVDPGTPVDGTYRIFKIGTQNYKLQ